MDKIEIKTMEDLRSCVSMLMNSVTAMCNEKDTDGVMRDFSVSKDLLIEIFKYNANRVDTSKN
jgi:hypothetical protein